MQRAKLTFPNSKSSGFSKPAIQINRNSKCAVGKVRGMVEWAESYLLNLGSSFKMGEAT